MGITATVKRIINSSLFSSQFQKTDVIESESAWPFEVTLAPAKTGVLSVRTDDDTGTVTMTTGHGFVTSDLVDIYWDGGSRRGMTATVTGDSVVLDGGSGDNLPIATTALTAMKPDLQIGSVVGANVVGIEIYSEQKGGFRLVYDDTGDVTLLGDEIAAGSIYSWFDGVDGDNPVDGQTIIKIYLSHSDSSASRKLRGALMYNS